MGCQFSSENRRVKTFFGGPPVDYRHGDAALGYIRRNTEQELEDTYEPPKKSGISILPLPIEIDESSLQLTEVTSTDGKDHSLEFCFRFPTESFGYFMKECTETSKNLSTESFKSIFESTFSLILHRRTYLKELNNDIDVTSNDQTYIMMNQGMMGLMFPDHTSKKLAFRSEKGDRFEVDKEVKLDEIVRVRFSVEDTKSLKLEKFVNQKKNELFGSGEEAKDSSNREIEVSEEEGEDGDVDNSETVVEKEKALVFRYMKYFPLMIEFQFGFMNLFFFLDIHIHAEKKVRIGRRFIQMRKFDPSKSMKQDASRRKQVEEEEEEEEAGLDRKKLIKSPEKETIERKKVDDIEIEYECEEIFGILNNEGENICVICLENTSEMVLTPCLHCCMCENCSEVLTVEKQSKSCPICRSNIDSLFKVPLFPNVDN